MTYWFAVGRLAGDEFVDLHPPITETTEDRAVRLAERMNEAWWSGRESLIVSHGLDVER